MIELGWGEGVNFITFSLFFTPQNNELKITFNMLMWLSDRNIWVRSETSSGRDSTAGTVTVFVSDEIFLWGSESAEISVLSGIKLLYTNLNSVTSRIWPVTPLFSHSSIPFYFSPSQTHSCWLAFIRRGATVTSNFFVETGTEIRTV